MSTVIKQRKYYLRVITTLYSFVRWNDCLSRQIVVMCGVRQGRVLSPLFFNIYVDDLISKLESSGFGCVVGNKFFGCFMYADDLLLMSASVLGLQSHNSTIQ